MKEDVKTERLLKGDLRRKIMRTMDRVFAGNHYEIKGHTYKGKCEGRYRFGVLFSFPDNTREFLSWPEAAMRIKNV